jgi:hypothetical protein
MCRVNSYKANILIIIIIIIIIIITVIIIIIVIQFNSLLFMCRVYS